MAALEWIWCIVNDVVKIEAVAIDDGDDYYWSLMNDDDNDDCGRKR